MLFNRFTWSERSLKHHKSMSSEAFVWPDLQSTPKHVQFPITEQEGMLKYLPFLCNF